MSASISVWVKRKLCGVFWAEAPDAGDLSQQLFLRVYRSTVRFGLADRLHPLAHASHSA